MDSRRILRKERLLICPYDPIHRVEAGTRFQRHLIQCSKNHPEIDEVICEFNRTHRIKSSEYPYHVMTCPDNAIVHKELIKIKNSFEMNPPKDIEVSNSDPGPNADAEDWETEALPEPICISALTQNHRQLKFVNSDMLSGLKPRQKKKFRKNLGKEGFPLNFDDDSEEEQEIIENAKANHQLQQEAKSCNDLNLESLTSKIKKIKPPSEIPMTAVPSLHLMNAGRGLNPAYRNPRIAANIFGGVNSCSPELGSSNSFATAGMGRGQMLEIRKRQKLQNNNTSSAKNLNIVTSPEKSAQMSDADEEEIQTVRTNSIKNFNKLNKTEESSSVVSDNFKLKRKLEKKLKQIEALEKKVEASGISSLNIDETNKLNSKEQVVEQLAQIAKENSGT